MPVKKGIIALMGSGELTSTMVEVHKELLARTGDAPRAVFLDTPAGFQLNADQLSRKAVDYFRTSVHYPLAVASLKTCASGRTYAVEKGLHALQEADFILIGPGSPTYAVRQWQQTTVPDILKKRIEQGACLVAASAAALTIGRFTLPVYEIYKVGEDLHWVDGMDILGHFGFRLVVIPHWNNAEGGTHDTRFCYMGEPRFRKLEEIISEDVLIVGLDEHTACIIDFETQEAHVKGIGRVTVRTRTMEAAFGKGERFSLEMLRPGSLTGDDRPLTEISERTNEINAPGHTSFWNKVHALEAAFQHGLDEHSWEKTTGALLDIDDSIWKAKEQGEQEEFVSQAREVMRDMLAVLGNRLAAAPASTREAISPLVEGLIDLRNRFREQKKWSDADGIRECLERVNVVIEDTKDGSLWQLK